MQLNSSLKAACVGPDHPSAYLESSGTALMHAKSGNHLDPAFAAAYLMRAYGKLPQEEKLDLLVDMYCHFCSISTDLVTLAMLGATLANKGVSVVNQKSCFATGAEAALDAMSRDGWSRYVPNAGPADVLGFGSDSGVSLFIAKGKFAVAVLSPRVTKYSENHVYSYRGVELWKILRNSLV